MKIFGKKTSHLARDLLERAILDHVRLEFLLNILGCDFPRFGMGQRPLGRQRKPLTLHLFQSAVVDTGYGVRRVNNFPGKGAVCGCAVLARESADAGLGWDFSVEHLGLGSFRAAGAATTPPL